MNEKKPEDVKFLDYNFALHYIENESTLTKIWKLERRAFFRKGLLMLLVAAGTMTGAYSPIS